MYPANLSLTPAPTTPQPTTSHSADHLATLQRLLDRRQQAVIRHRWLELVPLLSLSAARHRDPEAMWAFWKQEHMKLAVQCLSLGLPWATIRRYSLDDPRRSENVAQSVIRAAAERRRCRMGRVAGRSKHDKEGHHAHST